MDTNKANPREHSRQAIDAEILAEIKSLKEYTQEYTRESNRALRTLRRRRNALAPVSSLPTEVIAAIFSLLQVHVTPVAFSLREKPDQRDRLAWLQVTQVCHQWRDIALNNPLFWNHVDLTAFSSAGTTEILARAKNAPLYLEAWVPSDWDEDRFVAFQKELRDHVSKICHLAISAERFHLNRILDGLVSPAPTLEYLWLRSEDGSGVPWKIRTSVPDTLFNGTNGSPRLSCIKLWECNVSWQSPLLRGLSDLEICNPGPFIKPSLSAWLDALEEMTQLKTLALHWASPIAPHGAPLSYEVERTVTLPSLTVFEISSFARDCGFALAHLILPALTSLRFISIPLGWNGGSVREIIPYVARHVHGLQDTQPLQSMFFRNDITYIEILVWTLPDIDVDLPHSTDFLRAMRSSRMALSFTNFDGSAESEMEVFDALMDALPLDDLVTLTSQNRTGPLDEQFWLRHVPRWPLLRHVRLSAPGGRGFRETLEYNGGRESPLLPSLKRLVLIDTVLTTRRTVRLCDALMRRVDRGVPLETLDLRTCLSDSRTIEMLGEIVVDVLSPDETFETGAQILSMSIVRGLYHENISEMEDCDEDDLLVLDTGDDDVVREMDESEDEEVYL